MYFGKNLKHLRNLKSLNQSEISKHLGFKKTQWSGWETGSSHPKILDFIKVSEYFNISETDLIHTDLSEETARSTIQEAKLRITNEKVNSQEKLISVYQTQTAELEQKNLVPFYDDVVSIGGGNLVSEPQAIYNNKEYLNIGDWFPEATAAIRHYNESMVEYPSGCILVLKEIINKENIVWGLNYFIENSEMRVTKRLQAGENSFIWGYSTNLETYPDGKLVHEPFKIRLTEHLKIFLILGCVMKQQSSGALLIR